MKVSLQLDHWESETHFGKRRQLLIFIGVPDYVCQNISIAGIQAPDSHFDRFSEWCIFQTLSQTLLYYLVGWTRKVSHRHNLFFILQRCVITIMDFSEKLQNISSQKLQSRGSVHPTRECFSSKPATLSVTSHHLDVWSPSFKEKNMSFNWMNSRYLFHKITLSWIIAEWDSAGSSSPDEDFYEDEEADKCSFPVHKWFGQPLHRLNLQ